jgi:Glycogen recognition site of AMP-activated protein kinase
MNLAHLKTSKPNASNAATSINVRFAAPSPINLPIKHLMNNSALAEKSSDEVSQINVALFQLAERIENGEEAISTPFMDMMLDINKLEAVLKTVEKEKSVFSMSDLEISIRPESKNVSTKRNISRTRPETSTIKLIKAEFHLEAPSACSVKLAADFTDWEKYPLDMIKSEDGVWFTLVPLSPGQYTYRFIVDGEWRDDPRPVQRVPNPFGTANAVLKVT